MFFFFFQAEDGIRDKLVTGVQTCALPICVAATDRTDGGAETAERRRALQLALLELTPDQREVFVLKHVEGLSYGEIAERLSTRSEEHTSELQSLAYLVCRLLLEKKKKKNDRL